MDPPVPEEATTDGNPTAPTSPPGSCDEAAASRAADAVGRKRTRRNHNKELDGIHATLALLVDRDRQLQDTISTLRREASAAQGLLSSFQSIREAHEKEVELSKGVDLRNCLRNILLHRLGKCPSKPRRLNDDGQTSLVVTIDCSRDAFSQLLRLCSLQRIGSSARSALGFIAARVGDARRLLCMLGVPSDMTDMCMSRTFTRPNKTKVRRSIVHRVLDDEGASLFVLKKDTAGNRVTVAVRETEEFDASSQCFSDDLVVKTLSVDGFPELGTDPFCFSWREHDAASMVDGGLMGSTGKAALTVPLYVAEGHGTELSRLL